MSFRNVILTGFMATGKSSVGRLLAARLGYEWVDADAIIEARHGSIAQIFATKGETSFRRIEAELAVELSERRGLVISTGGRMMLDDRSANALSGGSRVFCLTATPDEIVRRVEKLGEPERPLLAGEDLRARIDVLLAERRSGYAKFEQVPTDGRSVAEVVDDIMSRLGVRA
jgi:shikimate kinase